MSSHRHFGLRAHERRTQLSEDARDLRLAVSWIVAALGIALAANWLALLVCVRAGLFFFGGE